MGFSDQLLAELRARLTATDADSIAVLGWTQTTPLVLAELHDAGLAERLLGVFDPASQGGVEPVRSWTELADSEPDLLVVAADAEKEDLLREFRRTCTAESGVRDVVLAGVAHLEFRDATFAELDAPALVPSYATGYANTRVHLFQCLEAAAAASLDGAVVELGAFKGGTTAWLARVVERLGLRGPVIAFDSWDGFPAKRSLLDLYAHPRCVFRDHEAVRRQLEPLGVEMVAGDIAETAPRRLAAEPILLAFVDTDNYSGARAALKAILPNLISGGSIVFDHFWTTEEYVYTLGERMAAQDVLGGAGLLQIHGTGVFVRIS